MFFRKMAGMSIATSTAALYSTYTYCKSTKRNATHYRYALTENEKLQLKMFGSNRILPTVVVIYDVWHGVTCADKGIKHLKDKGVKVIPIASDTGLNHPIFKSSDFNGIYLTGGYDIYPEDTRTKFEGQLIQIAAKNDIPLIGICRGLQTFGFHHGYTVKDISDRYQHCHSTVIVKPGSELFHAIQYKLDIDDMQSIEYSARCMHTQHMVDDPEKNNVKVTGVTLLDKQVESLEISTGIYTSVAFQHHPEVTIIEDFDNIESVKKEINRLDAQIKSLEMDAERAKESLKQEEEKVFRQVEEKYIKKQLNNPNYLDAEYAAFFLCKKKYIKIDEILGATKISQKVKSLTRQMICTKAEMTKAQNELKNYKIARAEFGVFIKQVKHHFLDQHQSQENGPKKIKL